MRWELSEIENERVSSTKVEYFWNLNENRTKSTYFMNSFSLTSKSTVKNYDFMKLYQQRRQTSRRKKIINEFSIYTLSFRSLSLLSHHNIIILCKICGRMSNFSLSQNNSFLCERTTLFYGIYIHLRILNFWRKREENWKK